MDDPFSNQQDFFSLDKSLFALQDPAYRAFITPLIPTVEPERVLGVRTPTLRALAKSLWREEQKWCARFMASLPHFYFEENMLHAFLIEQEKDFHTALTFTQAFLPHIDNWATCDSFSPKVFDKNPEALYSIALAWSQSSHEYTARYGIGILMKHFLDKHFRAEVLEHVAAIQREEYYVRMMVAWFFAEALAKQLDDTLPYLQSHQLETWTHNKAIQKAIESRRICPTTKAELRALRRKP
jgi:3-methyladenine DNA glycosylase AlkD